MFPKSINPASLLDGVFLKQLQNRFFEFPKIFGQLYRSILSNSINQSGNPPPKYLGEDFWKLKKPVLQLF